MAKTKCSSYLSDIKYNEVMNSPNLFTHTRTRTRARVCVSNSGQQAPRLLIILSPTPQSQIYFHFLDLYMAQKHAQVLNYTLTSTVTCNVTMLPSDSNLGKDIQFPASVLFELSRWKYTNFMTISHEECYLLDIILCSSLKIKWHFRATYHLHLQGWRVGYQCQRRWQEEIARWNFRLTGSGTEMKGGLTSVPTGTLGLDPLTTKRTNSDRNRSLGLPWYRKKTKTNNGVLGRGPMSSDL
jgi:hypothetical protein